MRIPQPKILEIKNAWLVDAIRVGKERLAGAFDSLLNFIPNLGTGIGRVRSGYSLYDESNNGITMPSNLYTQLVLPIQSPSQEDVHVSFGNDGGQTVHVNPWWQGSDKQTTNLRINEKITFEGGVQPDPATTATYVRVYVSSDYSPLATLTVSGSNTGETSLSQVANYYAGWILANTSKNPVQYARIKASIYVSNAEGNRYLFYPVDNTTVGNWGTEEIYTLYRNFHNNPTFAPTYNIPISYPDDPVCGSVRDSVIRFSGGQGSGAGNKGIVYFPHIKYVFFPSDATYTWTYEGSYIEEQRLRAPTKGDLLRISATSANAIQYNGIGDPANYGNSLDSGYTYWVAVAPIYDGYQVGELVEYITPTTDFAFAPIPWDDNYLKPGYVGLIDITPKVKQQLLSPRITGMKIFIAKDSGDTTGSGRIANYQFFCEYDFLADDRVNSDWSFDTATNYWIRGVSEVNKFTLLGSDFVGISGYTEYPKDTSYAYSIDEWIGGKRMIGNVYVGSEGKSDVERIFTNAVNSEGVAQLDVFPNEEDIYRVAVEPTVGTKLRGLKSAGMGELYVFKDRGILYGRPTDVFLNNYTWQIISNTDGLATINQIAETPNGFIFAGYNDCYSLEGYRLTPLIERDDKQDWLHTYKNTLTVAEREANLTFYLPELNCTVFVFSSSKQYMYFPGLGWRDILYADYFTRINKLQNGHVLGVTFDSPALVKRFTWKHNGTQYEQYFRDYVSGLTGTVIPASFDTGDLVVSQDVSKDTILSGVTIGKSLTGTSTGTLDCSIYNESTEIQFTGQDKTDTRLELHLKPSDNRIGQTFRVVYNNNGSSKEVLATGSILQIDGIEYYGRVRPRIRLNE